MVNRINSVPAVDELARLKKALLFIRNVVSDYRVNAFEHISFSHALAVSKAEELKKSVEPYCPVYNAFQGLTHSIKRLPLDGAAALEAEHFLNVIYASFELERVIFLKR